jgi:hypothetical protein
VTVARGGDRARREREKLGVADRTGAALFATKRGLEEPR